MCGVFAILFNRRLNDADITMARAGLTKLTHRGPDGWGEFVDREAGVYLGHRRLAIIDPTPASNQPMERDGAWISYNGEIYNFRELHGELRQKGIRFTSTGDVEVLLSAWQLWGKHTLDRLDGMFAFVLWDGDRAHIATDPFGEKPLFYAETKDGIIVCSEIGVLAGVLKSAPRLSGENLTAYLALGFVPPPETSFRDIKRVSAATYATVHRGALQHRERYWSLPPLRAPKGRPQPLTEANLDLISEALTTSISRRLIADASLCLFLSSGVDSALIAAIATRELNARLSSLTVSFPHGSTHDESDDAAAIADYLNLDHKIVRSTSDPRHNGPEMVLDLFGQPCDELPALAILQMSHLAALEHKVALTGMGGDEVFLGYGKHAFFYENRRYYRLPEFSRLGLGFIARLFGRFINKFEQTGYCFGVRDYERYLAHKCFPAIRWYQELGNYNVWCKKVFSSPNEPIEFAVPRNEIDYFMPGGRLVSMDVASMRASLELRTPYLSRNVVELVASLDPRSFMGFGQKSALRRILKRYLPEHLVDKPKRGFKYPADTYLSHFSQVPYLEQIPKSMIHEAWSHRLSGRGWTNLAVRIATAQFFLGRSA